MESIQQKGLGKLNSLRQEFQNVEPSVFVKIMNIYATRFYGSSLWDLFSKECEIMFTAWNVAIRISFAVGMLGSSSHCCSATSFLSGSWPGLSSMIWELSMGEISDKLILNVASVCQCSSSPLQILSRKQWSTVMCQAQNHGMSACCMTSLMLETKFQLSLASPMIKL